MNKEFVPYEESLAMKELEFDEECFRYYHTDKSLRKVSEGWYNEVCSAPLWQQAFDWFREKYRIDGVTHVSWSGKDMFEIREWLPEAKGWYAINGVYGFDSSKDAKVACLRELIKIVINKTK